MYLLRAQLEAVPPFGTIELPFADDDGRPRPITVVHAAGGAGKTVLLSVLAATRPGNASVLFGGALGSSATATCEWHLGRDDAERPHPLIIATPSQVPARVGDDDALALRRREQALFDRRAKDGGFVFMALPTIRCFSRVPVAVHAPSRTVAHYDVRATVNLDDPQRSDLTRDTKMALAYAAISAALMAGTQGREAGERGPVDMRLFGAAMHEVVDSLARLSGFSYLGLDPISMEPAFASPGHRRMPFDGLPTRSRHLVAIAALSVRTLWAAYPGTDPRAAEGVIAIDDIDLYQDAATQEGIVHALRTALPQVQWILTTSSPIVAGACDTRELLSLRRLPDDDRVELFVDAQARTH
jgi:hypothetical protein